ncbi:hypothetical protein L1887_36294 [Cichorium endivia]|nr:hypothetical protein L1887_36294 [Cichorium endivia]
MSIWLTVFFYWALTMASCTSMLLCFACIYHLFYECSGPVQDIETGRIPPPSSTTTIRHIVVALQPANLDQQATVKPNGDLAEIVQEKIYDSSTCKNDNCVICLEEFKNDEKIRVLVSCRHSFHGHCINVWLFGNRSCPICRGPIGS